MELLVVTENIVGSNSYIIVALFWVYSLRMSVGRSTASIIQNQLELLSSFAHHKSLIIITDSELTEIRPNLICQNFLAVIPITDSSEFSSSDNPHQLLALFTALSKQSLLFQPFLVFDILFPENNLSNILYTIMNVTNSVYRNNIWQPTIMILWKAKEHTLQSTSQLWSTLSNSLANSTVSLMSLDSKIFLASRETQSELVNFWEFYRIKRKLFVSQVGTSFATEKNLEPYFEAFAERRSNFHLEKFTATVKKTDEFNKDWATFETREDGTQALTSNSYVAWLYQDLQKLMNFSETVIVGDSPVIAENGTLIGKTVDQLNQNEADATLTKMTLNEERARALTFLTPTHNSLTFAFFKQPTPNSLHDFVVAPFKTDLWLALVGVWFIIALSVKFFELIKMPENDRKFTAEGFLWSVATICQKSWHLNPNSISLRIKLMITNLTSTIVYAAYSAFIVSSLAITGIPIKSFKDLYSQSSGKGSQFIFTVHKNSQPFQELLEGFIEDFGLHQRVERVSTENEINHLFKQQVKANNEVVVSSKRAFLSYADLFYKLASFQNYSSAFVCNHISYFPLRKGHLSKSAMLVKKGSEFKEVLNFMLLHLKSVGLIPRNNERYNANNILQCIPPEETLANSVDPATLADVLTIVGIFICAIPLSLVAFLLENASHKFMCKYRLDSIFNRRIQTQ